MSETMKTHGGHELAELVRRGKIFHGFQLSGDLRLQAFYQEAHFLHPVFQRCAGHKQNVFRPFQKSQQRLCPLGIRVLDIMGFIGDHHGYPEFLRKLEAADGFIGGDRHIAVHAPLKQGFFIISMDLGDR